MLVKDLYLSIKVGIVPLGLYSEGAMLDTEIALKLDTYLHSLLNQTKQEELIQENSFYDNLLSDLIASKNKILLTRVEDFYICNLPTDLNTLLRLEAVYIKKTSYTNTLLTIGDSYEPIVKAKINEVWYSSNNIIKATLANYEGKVYKVCYNTIPIGISSSEKFAKYSKSNFSSSNYKELLGEKLGNEVRIAPYNTTPIEYCNLVYYKKPYKFIDMDSNSECPYSESVLAVLIEKFINDNKIK
jgi:hypothetical protein